MNFLKNITDNFNSGGYLKDLSILAGGTVLAQIIPLIFYPVLTRIFTPSDFGLLSSILAFSNILTHTVTGKYEKAIIISKSKMEAVNVLILALSLAVFCLFACSIATYFLFDEFDFISRSIKYKSILFAPFLISLFSIIFTCYNEWCVKYKYFKDVSYNKIINGGFPSIMQLICGLLGLFQAISLIIGDVIGKGLSAICCVFNFSQKDAYYLRYVSIKRLKIYFLRYIDFPKFNMPGQLINTLGGSIPIFSIGYFFSASEVGFYSMANLVIALPAIVVGRAMADAFRNKATEIYAKTGNCRYIYIKNILFISAISILGYSLLYFIAPQLFILILGDNWAESGIYARILMPIVATSMVSEVVSSMFIISEKQKAGLYWQIFYLVMSVMPFALVYWIKDIYTVLYIFVFCRMCAYIVNLALTYKFTIRKKGFKKRC